jgi:predicted ATP-grasp superfamily ATP-dependent carboligase
MHVSRDLAAAHRQILAGTLSPLTYLKSLRRPLEFAAFAMDDPLPALLDLPMAAWRIWTRRRRANAHVQIAR